MIGLGLWAMGLLVVVLLHLIGRFAPRLLRRPLLWGWEWLRARMEQPDVGDRAVNELSLVLQRERLCANLDRVELLMATDDWMSATRQMGNRLAYNRLLLDLKQLPGRTPIVSARSYGEAAPTPTKRRAWESPPVPQVEFLEIGLRH